MLSIAGSGHCRISHRHVLASGSVHDVDRSDRAVEVCLDYLRHVGVEWSPHPTKKRLDGNTSGSGTQLGEPRD